MESENYGVFRKVSYLISCSCFLDDVETPLVDFQKYQHNLRKGKHIFFFNSLLSLGNLSSK